MNNDDVFWADQIKDITECSLILLKKLEKTLKPEQGSEIDGMKQDLELIISIVDEVINDSTGDAKSSM
jgi:hypothetical protein